MSSLTTLMTLLGYPPGLSGIAMASWSLLLSSTFATPVSVGAAFGRTVRIVALDRTVPLLARWCGRLHDQAMQWIARHATDEAVSVLDLGGRDVNGNPQSLFPNATKYTVLDILPGDGVDIVADAATWEPDQQHDWVLSAECFEHTASWPAICRTAFKALHPGGKFIVTTAGPGRPPHSMHDGLFRLLPGEHYANVPAFELERVLKECGFRDIVVDSQWAPNPCDTRAVATKPEIPGRKHEFEPYHWEPARCGYVDFDDVMCGYPESDH